MRARASPGTSFLGDLIYGLVLGVAGGVRHCRPAHVEHGLRQHRRAARRAASADGPTDSSMFDERINGAPRAVTSDLGERIRPVRRRSLRPSTGRSG